MPVALVTDSTASLPADLVRERRITVVPLQVVIGAKAYDEGVDAEVTPQMLAEALRGWVPVSTSRPNPDAMLEVYDKLAADGAEAIVSVHISGELSGTFESAQLAGRRASVPVIPVDSRQVGMGTGFAVLAAADAIADGADAEAVAAAARDRAASTTSLFYVDTLEYLRRGGRMGAAAALVGSALAVKPILTLDDGRVVPFEKVRTATKALSRLEELAVDAGQTPTSTSRWPTWPAPTEPRSWPSDWPTGSGPAWADGRSRSARSARSSARTSVPGWSPWRCRGGPERPHPTPQLSCPQVLIGRFRPVVPLPSVEPCPGSHTRRSLPQPVAASSCSVASSSRPGCAASTTPTTPTTPTEAPQCPSRRSSRRRGDTCASRDRVRPGGWPAGCVTRCRTPCGGAPNWGRPVLLVVALVAAAVAGTVFVVSRMQGESEPLPLPATSPGSAAPMLSPGSELGLRAAGSHEGRDRRCRRKGAPPRGDDPAGRVAGGGRAPEGGRCAGGGRPELAQPGASPGRR